MEDKDIREWVSLFKSGGEANMMAFCRKHVLNYQQFRYHLKRSLIPELRGGGFAGIVVQKKTFATGSSFSPGRADVVARLVAGGQVRLEVEGIFTAAFLRELAGC